MPASNSGANFTLFALCLAVRWGILSLLDQFDFFCLNTARVVGVGLVPDSMVVRQVAVGVWSIIDTTASLLPFAVEYSIRVIQTN